MEDHMNEENKFGLQNSHLILKNVSLFDIFHLQQIMVSDPLDDWALHISSNQYVQREIIDNQSFNNLHEELTSCR